MDFLLLLNVLTNRFVETFSVVGFSLEMKQKIGRQLNRQSQSSAMDIQFIKLSMIAVFDHLFYRQFTGPPRNTNLPTVDFCQFQNLLLQIFKYF